MTTTAHPLTAGDLLRTPDDGGPHESIRMLLGGLLFQHVRAHRLGVLFSEATGFHLARDPDTVRCPDVSFLSRTRIPEGRIRPGVVEGAPDLAVEVLSPGDTVFEIEGKVEEHLAAGCGAVWVVNPKLQRVTVQAPSAAPRVFGENEMFDGGEVLPGFVCLVRELFSWPE